MSLLSNTRLSIEPEPQIVCPSDPPDPTIPLKFPYEESDESIVVLYLRGII